MLGFCDFHRDGDGLETGRILGRSSMNITNFRDLGGIGTIHGRLVRPHKFIRSGQLVGLDEETKRELVDRYQVTQVVDFRRPFEIQESPDDRLEGVTFTNIDLLEQSGTNSASLDDFASLGLANQVNGHMLNVYHDLVMSPAAQQGYGRFLRIVVDNTQGATLFHCFAGKDRTGFAAALVLWLLEVDDAQIFADYLKTNQERVAANNQLLDQFRARGFDQDSLDALQIALCVKKEYLAHAQETMVEAYGDVFAYARQALGFGPDQVETLRSNLLE
ncbi:protein-tyrosine-phosphatase [Bifidobacterium asteroides]|uniref:Protein-tyrosine-phosphatase n=2 Tax=Bifidobacterium asteroides TaxID=1684 RepID=A0A318N5N5_9BIFI|nr:protein-tyrosine-phosphatase [Bifidobacterium asteroides]